MRFRFTTWLLALWTLTAGFAGLPPARTAPVRAPYSIVSVTRDAKRAERRVAELPAALLPPPPSPVFYSGESARAVSPPFDSARFQRPPPPQPFAANLNN